MRDSRSWLTSRKLLTCPPNSKWFIVVDAMLLFYIQRATIIRSLKLRNIFHPRLVFSLVVAIRYEFTGCVTLWSQNPRNIVEILQTVVERNSTQPITFPPLRTIHQLLTVFSGTNHVFSFTTSIWLSRWHNLDSHHCHNREFAIGWPCLTPFSSTWFIFRTRSNGARKEQRLGLIIVRN